MFCVNSIKLIHCSKNNERNLSNNISYRKSLLEDELDEFVSNIIKEERNKTGSIYNYRSKLSEEEIRQTNEPLHNYVDSFVLNDKIHIIKLDDKRDSFFDIVKKLF